MVIEHVSHVDAYLCFLVECNCIVNSVEIRVVYQKLPGRHLWRWYGNFSVIWDSLNIAPFLRLFETLTKLPLPR